MPALVIQEVALWWSFEGGAVGAVLRLGGEGTWRKQRAEEKGLNK